MSSNLKALTPGLTWKRHVTLHNIKILSSRKVTKKSEFNFYLAISIHVVKPLKRAFSYLKLNFKRRKLFSKKYLDLTETRKTFISLNTNISVLFF